MVILNEVVDIDRMTDLLLILDWTIGYHISEVL